MRLLKGSQRFFPSNPLSLLSAEKLIVTAWTARRAGRSDWDYYNHVGLLLMEKDFNGLRGMLFSMLASTFAKVQADNPSAGKNSGIVENASLQTPHAPFGTSILFARISSAVRDSNLSTLPTQTISLLAWSFAKLHLNDPLLPALAAHITKTNLFSHFKPQEISVTLYSFAKLECLNSGPDGELFGDDLPHQSLFKNESIVRLDRPRICNDVTHQSLFKSASNEILNRFGIWNDLKPNEISNILWSFDKVHIRNIPLFATASTHILKNDLLYTHLSAHSISNILSSFAHSRIPNKKLFSEASKAIMNRQLLRGAKPQTVSNILWSYATVGLKYDSLFNASAPEIIASVNDFNIQELSNSIWAFSTLHIKNHALFDTVAISIVKRDLFRDGNVQNMSNILWSFASIGLKPRPLFDAASSILNSSDFKYYKPQNVSNIFWAFAKVGIRDESMFHSLAPLINGDLKDFNGQNIANTIWAFATLNINNEALFEAVAKVISEGTIAFKLQEISSILWSFAKMGIKNDSIFQILSTSITDLTPHSDVKLQALSNILWAHATLDIKNQPLFSAIALHIQSKDLFSVDCLPQEISNTLWALSKLGFYDPGLFSYASDMIVSRHWDGFSHQQMGNTLLAFANSAADSAIYGNLFSNAFNVIKSKSVFDSIPCQNLSQILYAFSKTGDNEEVFKMGLDAVKNRKELGESWSGYKNTRKNAIDEFKKSGKDIGELMKRVEVSESMIIKAFGGKTESIVILKHLIDFETSAGNG